MTLRISSDPKQEAALLPLFSSYFLDHAFKMSNEAGGGTTIEGNTAGSYLCNHFNLFTRNVKTNTEYLLVAGMVGGVKKCKKTYKFISRQ